MPRRYRAFASPMPTNGEIQHDSLDRGAMVLVVTTVRSYEQSSPGTRLGFLSAALGDRRAGGGPGTAGLNMWGKVPGGYRNTVNDNLVMILMIETLQGLKDADRDHQNPRRDSDFFAASGDLGNRTGYGQDFCRITSVLINIVHDAAIKGRIRLCGPFCCGKPPRLHLLPEWQRETGLIAIGAKAELGALWNTQGKPEVEPRQPRVCQFASH